MTCETCVHWTTDDGEMPRLPSHFGACSSDKFIGEYFSNGELLEADRVVVENDEGWGFYTGPKFGCVHWVPRQDTK